MKGIVGIFVVGIIAAVGAVMMMKKSVSEDSIAIAMGFGEGKNNQIEMNSVVGKFITTKDPPRVDRVTGTVYWDEWVEDHFQLFDAGRQRVGLTRVSGSSVIPDRKAGEMVEFFLSAKLTPGEEYVYEYIPIKAEKKRFRYTFTVPNDKKTLRPNFELVD